MEVVERAVAELKPARRNARVHSDAQIAQIMGSIRQFGFNTPVLLDDEDRILAGHGRVEAAKRLQRETVPTIMLSHLTMDERRAFALADNKIALNAAWDMDELRLELAEIFELQPEFELDVTGFTTVELDILLDETEASKPDRDEASPEPRRWPTTQLGDLWDLGRHRLLCGDSRDPVCFQLLMGNERARMVFSDPPYNVKIDGHVGGLGAVKHREFAMASGEMSEREFTDFLEVVFANARAVSIDGALHFQCMDWRHSSEMLKAGHAVYDELKNICVWAKDNGGMGSLYRSQHEFVFVWKVGTAPHLNNVELGKHGRYRTNVWNYRGATKIGPNAELNLHPTVKPVAMIADAIKDVSERDDIVLDAFGGSGSTLIAAERTKRRARLIELDPSYCDVIVERWQRRTRRAAVLVETGETFAQVKAKRAAEMDRIADAALAEEAA